MKPDILRPLLDLLFPRRCPGCGALAGRSGICAQCAPTLHPIAGPVCPRCGREHCRCDPSHPPAYDRLVGVYYYDQVERGIHTFKFDGRAGMALPYAQAMAAQLGRLLPGARYDWVVAVPMHPKKERARGYNQAALLAREIARTLRTPILFGALRQQQNSTQHFASSPAERLQRAEASIVPDRVDRLRRAAGKRILLVDDIATTGATLGRCASLLRAAGACEIDCITIALVRRARNEE